MPKALVSRCGRIRRERHCCCGCPFRPIYKEQWSPQWTCRSSSTSHTMHNNMTSDIPQRGHRSTSLGGRTSVESPTSSSSESSQGEHVSASGSEGETESPSQQSLEESSEASNGTSQESAASDVAEPGSVSESEDDQQPTPLDEPSNPPRLVHLWSCCNCGLGVMNAAILDHCSECNRLQCEMDQRWTVQNGT